MTPNEILYHHLSTCGKPLVTVCPICGKLYWQAVTKAERAAKKAAK